MTYYTGTTKIINEDFKRLLTETGCNTTEVPVGHGTVIDFRKTPHLLVAGTTGSGKTSAIHTLILSLAYCSTPAQVQMIFIDPKMIEFNRYRYLPHRMMDPVYDLDDAFQVLDRVKAIMMDRFHYMMDNDLEQYEGTEIYVFIDEIAELIFHNKSVVGTLSSIARLSRAAGIHLCCATQLPTRKILSNQVVANFDAKLVMHCSDPISYRTILGHTPKYEPIEAGEAIVQRNGKEKYIETVYTSRNDYDYFLENITFG